MKALTIFFCSFLICICTSCSISKKNDVANNTGGILKTSTPEEQGMDSEILLKMFEFIKSDPEMDFHSILIIRHGYLVNEAYWSPYNKEITHNTKSAAKSIISSLVGIALEKSYLENVNQKVKEFYPEYVEEPLKRNITLRNLMTMSSGLDWIEGMGPSPFELKSWNAVKMKYNPGKAFEYNTSQTHMMSAILTKACGESTKDFADKWLFKPLDINNYQWRKSEEGIYFGGSDIFLTPRDMAKFGVLYLNRGNFNGQSIISEKWINESSSKKIDIPKGYAFGNGLSYGYWWYIDEKTYFAWGFGGQFIIIRPDLDLVVVFTSNFNDIDIYNNLIKRLLQDYVFHSVKSDTQIPPNPKAHIELSGVVGNFENPLPVPFSRNPHIESIVSNVNYGFDKNDLGIQSTAFSFSDSSCTWQYFIGDEKVNLKVGLNGVFLLNDIECSMGVNPEKEKIACKGYWERDKFIIVHHIIGDPSKQIFTFNFSDTDIDMDLTTLGMNLRITGKKY